MADSSPQQSTKEDVEPQPVEKDELNLPSDDLNAAFLTINNENFLDCLDVFKSSDEKIFNDVQSLVNKDDRLLPDEIFSTENEIIKFCTKYCPLKKNHCTQCRTYISLAQNEITQQRYGHAIVRFKDFSSFVDNVAVSKNKTDFSTGRLVELKTLVAERIALCYLLKNNPQLAIKYAQKAIVQKPVVAQSHIWRAISYRRLNKLSQCLKSLTTFGALISASLEELLYQVSEQETIVLYWKMILALTQRQCENVKVLHFPSSTFNNLSKKDQQERMSVTFLMNYPQFNSLIQSDANALHLLPVSKGTFVESLQEQKHVYGFMRDNKDARYFARLPEAKFISTFDEIARNKQLPSEFAYDLWQTSSFINSTCFQMSLRPGRDLHEHLLYCYSLVNEERYGDVLPEYESILADLALFPVLSDEGWSDKLAVQVDANVEMIESVIASIKEQSIISLESSRHIEQIKQWLELSERKFRVRRSLSSDEGTSTRRLKQSPKRKYKHKQTQNVKRDKQSIAVNQLVEVVGEAVEFKSK